MKAYIFPDWMRLGLLMYFGIACLLNVAMNLVGGLISLLSHDIEPLVLGDMLQLLITIIWLIALFPTFRNALMQVELTDDSIRVLNFRGKVIRTMPYARITSIRCIDVRDSLSESARNMKYRNIRYMPKELYPNPQYICLWESTDAIPPTISFRELLDIPHMIPVHYTTAIWAEVQVRTARAKSTEI